MDNCNILLGCTGSVASIKTPLLVSQLLKKSESRKIRLRIRVLPTTSALHFFDSNEVKTSVVEVVTDGKNEADSRLSLELARWADLLLVAPLDANTLAKFAHGIADNLLTSVVRSWAKKPLIFAPAMNTAMWDHPLTSEQIDRLKVLGYEEIPPIDKLLVCGDKGSGAMANVDDIVEIVFKRLCG